MQYVGALVGPAVGLATMNPQLGALAGRGANAFLGGHGAAPQGAAVPQVNLRGIPNPQGVPDANFGITPLGPMHLNGYTGNYGSAATANPSSFLTGMPTHVNDVNWAPTANHNLSFRGSNGQMFGPNTQLGGFSGSNPLAFGVGRGGAGVIGGEAAQDFMRAAHQSIFANRQQGTDAAGHRNAF
jgi:hypothetical protein